MNSSKIKLKKKPQPKQIIQEYDTVFSKGSKGNRLGTYSELSLTAIIPINCQITSFEILKANLSIISKKGLNCFKVTEDLRIRTNLALLINKRRRVVYFHSCPTKGKDSDRGYNPV